MYEYYLVIPKSNGKGVKIQKYNFLCFLDESPNISEQSQ